MVMDIQMVIHLGDDYSDADFFLDATWDVMHVPGLWTDHYMDPEIPNRMFSYIEGWKFFLTHSREKTPYDLADDLNPYEIYHQKKTDVFLFGHTHNPIISYLEGIILINPGHLKSGNDRGHAPTFVIAEVTPKQMKATLINFLTDSILQEQVFFKLSVS